MFQLSDVGFEVEGKRLLQAFDLDFEDGMVYGLIGHNGSGKSTLLKLLARQHQPSRGRLLLDGRELYAWGSREFARRVAYLPQHLPPTDHLTVRELVGFGRYPWRGPLGRLGSTDHSAIDAALRMTYTDDFAERMVNTLSGGERQRAWLAMLIAQQSRFLLLDEPLAALDVAHQVEVMGLVRRLSHELGLGVVIVIHDINMAARYCDRLVALHGGRLLEHGPAEALMRPATLEAVYGIPMQIIGHPVDDRPVAVVH